MTVSGILIGALKSGSGKTLLTCGLLALLKERGKKVAAFKCGPDYIDPMFHKKVIGVPSENLDTYLAGKKGARNLFEQRLAGQEIGVIEGVMGLFDGVGGTTDQASAYDVARTTGTPILLVVDAKGMGRTMIPMLSGILSYDESHLIRGIILNRTTEMFYKMMAEQIQQELHIPVVGYVPQIPEVSLDSRHLGLIMPEEIANLEKQVQRVAAILTKTLDLNQILKIAAQRKETEPEPPLVAQREGSLRIAVARDAAFCFYYEENLRSLEKFGAELIYFSPLRDDELPDHIQGLILGGGYPENYAKELSENSSMRRAVKAAIQKGLPSIAECGGFLYLTEQLEDEEGQSHSMCGLIKADSRNAKKLVRFGYVEVHAKTDSFLKKEASIRGHEFHYYDTTENGTDCEAIKPVTGRSWNCIHAGKNYWWGFPHLYYGSNPDFVTGFLREAQAYGSRT